MENMKNVAKNILQLVETFPHLKENYNALVGYYWTIFDGVKNVDDFARATPAETITRCFRKLVELGKIELPERVAKARKERAETFKHEFAAIG
jgi:hypothetical protein